MSFLRTAFQISMIDFLWPTKSVEDWQFLPLIVV